MFAHKNEVFRDLLIRGKWKEIYGSYCKKIKITSFGFYVFLWNIGDIIKRAKSKLNASTPALVVFPWWYNRCRSCICWNMVSIVNFHQMCIFCFWFLFWEILFDGLSTLVHVANTNCELTILERSSDSISIKIYGTNSGH